MVTTLTVTGPRPSSGISASVPRPRSSSSSAAPRPTLPPSPPSCAPGRAWWRPTPPISTGTRSERWKPPGIRSSRYAPGLTARSGLSRSSPSWSGTGTNTWSSPGWWRSPTPRKAAWYTPRRSSPLFRNSAGNTISCSSWTAPVWAALWPPGPTTSHWPIWPG